MCFPGRTLSAGITAYLIIAIGLAPPVAADSQSAVTFTVDVSSTFARSSPSRDATLVASVFKGNTYPVVAQNGEATWLQLGITGVAPDAWVPASLGTINGDLANVPVASPQAVVPTLPPPTPMVFEGPPDPILPAVSPTAREIYWRGLALGNNPRHFSKIGDCQNVPSHFLGAFDFGAYRLGEYGYLQATIDQFRGGFARESAAVEPGFNVAAVFVTFWADPARCLPTETPLECEYRLYRPSIAIVSLEQWWGGTSQSYEHNLRRIIEFLTVRGVVPILSTKADNLEGNHSLNRTIAQLAAEYDVPLWNFWLAAQALPDNGLIPDGFHLAWGRPNFDDPRNLQLGWPVRNLTALQALNAVWQGASTP